MNWNWGFSGLSLDIWRVGMGMNMLISSIIAVLIFEILSLHWDLDTVFYRGQIGFISVCLYCVSSGKFFVGFFLFW